MNEIPKRKIKEKLRNTGDILIITSKIVGGCLAERNYEVLKFLR